MFDITKFSAEELTSKLKDRSPEEVAKLFSSVGIVVDPKLSVADQVAQAKAAQPSQPLTPPVPGVAPSAAPNLPPTSGAGAVSNLAEQVKAKFGPALNAVAGAAAQAQAPEQEPTLYIRTTSAHPNGRKRAGRVWSNALTPVLKSDFTAEQWAALEGDPLIQIRKPK